MATDNIAKSLSCSWGWMPADPSSDDPYFKEFAAQGQSLFVASGDSGSFPNSVFQYVYPADDAYVTSVGGTDLTTTGAGGAWESETAWSDSGGGISPDHIAIPSYQTTAGVITAANKGSTTYRNARTLPQKRTRTITFATAAMAAATAQDNTARTMGRNEFRGAPMGRLHGAGESTIRGRNGEYAWLHQPGHLHDWVGVELWHRLPRHHQRQ